MREEEAKTLLARYSVSHFWRPTSGDTRAGDQVPVLKGRELVAAMIQNVEESRRDVEQTAARMARARQDGILDRDAFAGLSKETKAVWVGAVGTLRGDHARALSDMAHWQEYAEWASEQEAAGTPRNPSPPFKPDPRLPPEPDEDDCPF